ncbi:TonB-dependent receptor [Sphingobacterium psychroaquaticum]|uniref:TonB-dependent receptor n=1 Tax=Sphingobacterium psychroaquaticum TaxID=561061 RepID=UPI00106AF237|nr:TonB-dependent receptor [Sphingobacterium psychroaquaticum]QBQ40264.1 TonB-dependent receptor [Sphingobacterium psychroaquaticum]
MNKLNYYVAVLISVLLTQVSITKAQQFGVKGKVLDLETFQPIPGVSIKVANTTYAASTNEKGEFSINLPTKANEYTIVCTFVGYKADSTRFNLQTADWAFVPVSLINASSTLEEVVVTRRRERASEIALLEERRLSSLSVEKIGAEELSRKGITDAAAALTKMSGVSKQETNTQLYVRGLGDRYISTSLNGLPIPSNNPNLKNIGLDMFSTDVVDYVGVDKLHHSRLNGDFGGASIDIASKDYKGDRMFEVSVGSSVNTNVLGNTSNLYMQQGPNYWGFSNYKVPADATGSYHFQNSWVDTKKLMTPINFGLKAGNAYRVGENGRLSFFAMANFANGYGYREGVNSNFSAQGAPLKALNQQRVSYNTATTAMLNTNYQINNDNKLTYNFLFVNSSDQYRDNFSGYIVDKAEDYNGLIQRGTYEQTQLIINQLLGTHKLNQKIDLQWGLAYNRVNGDMPDRMQSTLKSSNGEWTFVRNNAADNHRYTYLLTENEIAGNIAATYKIGDNDRGKLTVGIDGRRKERAFKAIQLNFDIRPDYRNVAVDPKNLDLFLNQQNFGVYYDLESFSGNGYQTYNGEQDIYSGYASLDYKLTEKLNAVLGMRYENIRQYVDYYSIELPAGGNNTFKKNGVLPSLNLKYTLNDKQNLRLGASKTYTLPQFKERALFPYEEINVVYKGNPYLYPSDNYNVDLKWEFFPKSSELLSVTAFGKYIKNPINEITISSATNDISYINTGDKGYVYGVELELKKDLLTFNEEQDKLSFGFNTALMRTTQNLDAVKVNRETNGLYNLDVKDKAGFTGASDVLINADLSYSKKFTNERSITATLLYNYYSDKLFAIGVNGLGDQVDRGLGTMDFVLKSKLSKRIGLDLSARNILNPEFQRWQEDAVPVKVLSYKRGANFSLSLKYQL